MRALLLLGLAAVLTACGGRQATRPGGQGKSSSGWSDNTSLSQDRRYRERADSSPSAAPPAFIYTMPQPVPKPEPRSRYGNKSPYSVRGKSYRVLPSARGYDERGIASYYGNKFHGYKTSSLEDYDMYKFSAASKELPLPSYARVTNLANGKSVIVRVNDRGPFHEGRIIDLSYAAAVRIGIWPKGTGMVEVQGLVPGGEPPPPIKVTTGAKAPGIYLQVGAFAEAANAERLAARLRRAALPAVRVETVQIDGRTMRRVQIGPLADADSADSLTDRIERMGLPRPHVTVN